MSDTYLILHQCLDEAVAAAAGLLEKCLDQAITSLQDSETKSTKVSERQEMADAWRELQKHRSAWVGRFPRDLRLALEAGPKVAETPRASVPGSGFASLTLVDDSSVVQAIESQRLTQLLLSAVEQSLAELDGLMSSALRLDAVRPENNPVRPEIFSRTLRALLATTPVQPAVSALWTQHLAGPLGRELDRLYRDLSRRLTAADVHAAPYRVLPASSAHGALLPVGDSASARLAREPDPPTRPAEDDFGGREVSGWADLSSDTLAGPLLQNFLSQGGNFAQSPLAPAYYERVARQLSALEALLPADCPGFDPEQARQHQHLPAVDRPLRPVGTESPLDEEVWGSYGTAQQRSLVRTRLKQQARHVSQALGLEVVRKLVDQVARDPRLLGPVREAVVALEPSLLRLAMVDPRFLGDEQHPARRLLERVADRSFKYNDEFSPEFKEFSASIAATFNSLNEQEISSAAPFQQVLSGLETAWTAQDHKEETGRAEMLGALRFAEQRQADADRIAWAMNQRADLENVPAVVQDFLFGPWALVMAHARLVDAGQQIDPGGYGGIVSNLMWSVKREVTLRQPAKLINMIPSMLLALRSGLAALGQDARENEPFFLALEKLHRPVLKLRARQRRNKLDVEARQSDLAPLEAEVDADADAGAPLAIARVKPEPGEQLWMGRKELDAAGFEDTMPTDQAALMLQRESGFMAVQPEAGESDQAPEPVAVDIEGTLANLRENCWVDLYSKQRWLRARLVWSSGKGTLFMFVSHGGQPHSMTRRSCERLVRDRLLRLVRTHGAVSHAIDKMTHEPTRPQPLAA